MPAKLTLRKGAGKTVTVTCKTSHQFARELLKLADLPIYHFDPSRAGMDDVLDTSIAAPIAQVCEEPECGNKRRKVRFVTIVGEGVGIGDDEPGAFAEQVINVLETSMLCPRETIDHGKKVVRELPKGWHLVARGMNFQRGDREWSYSRDKFVSCRRKYSELRLVVPAGLVVIRRDSKIAGGVH